MEILTAIKRLVGLHPNESLKDESFRLQASDLIEDFSVAGVYRVSDHVILQLSSGDMVHFSGKSWPKDVKAQLIMRRDLPEPIRMELSHCVKANATHPKDALMEIGGVVIWNSSGPVPAPDDGF